MIDPETGEAREPEEPEIDPEKFEQYRDQIEERDVTPDDFGRIAAQTAKQVILQRIREAERDMMFEEYRDRVGELITGIVQQSDSRYTLVQLRERVEALLPKSEQVDGERYEHSGRIKAVIKEVSASTKGPSIIVSRRDPELIKKLFELEVPEIADGLVEITDVAREPGYRSKIAVVSHADGVDPVGACVGPRGSRVRMVVSELRGEKIDIIPYNDEPARFVAKALSPARVREVLVDDDGQAGDGDRPRRPALAGDRPRGPERPPRRPPDRLARRHPLRDRVLGRGGRARLRRGGGLRAAAPRSCRPAAAARTPSLPGSRYCGLDSHQALRRLRHRQGRRAQRARRGRHRGARRSGALRRRRGRDRRARDRAPEAAADEPARRQPEERAPRTAPPSAARGGRAGGADRAGRACRRKRPWRRSRAGPDGRPAAGEPAAGPAGEGAA